MSISPETGAFLVAGSMVSALRAAAQVSVNIADQAVENAWAHELALARGNAGAMGRVAAAAVRQVGALEAEVESLEDEVARLRTLLAQRNATIRSLTGVR